MDQCCVDRWQHSRLHRFDMQRLCTMREAFSQFPLVQLK
ncbi:hypothetical protein XCR_2323 [Xanthomonas campestris pv. raphani 756C]|nr:hypothetical protein XCR_2323 [Xanthomonas campestris pv. raphani 756C]